ncbi:hypothetical protein PHLGIDRAFT_19836 [Phlebiopsis gigantea 11061_1 CR5-6]|uniref:Uncharacterized protein n=1 Tax=Phlebiopsis gigantea (strain 11061_1 CR5-6) TaxID=745531 RepID=A0A0C3S7X6_PHLG1|nr:hypothetical protein PHLGIDRAFT_19836 [Phlebiopsis gigantea 11061_1 CR5-6]
MRSSTLIIALATFAVTETLSSALPFGYTSPNARSFPPSPNKGGLSGGTTRGSNAPNANGASVTTVSTDGTITNGASGGNGGTSSSESVTGKSGKT